jgi:hypothetical protein
LTLSPHSPIDPRPKKPGLLAEGRFRAALSGVDLSGFFQEIPFLFKEDKRYVTPLRIDRQGRSDRQ